MTMAAPLAYWKKQLGGVCRFSICQQISRRRAAASVKGARQKFVLDKTLTAGLKVAQGSIGYSSP